MSRRQIQRIVAAMVREVRDECERTTEILGGDATEADYYADAARRLEFIANGGEES